MSSLREWFSVRFDDDAIDVRLKSKITSAIRP
jgi:hypothetical protein